MADRRMQIITATNELFRAQGFHGTSLSQISGASGATTGSIYHCFPGGKEELTAVVIETTAAVYRDLFLAIVDEHDEPVAALEACFAAAAEVLADSDYIDPCPIGTIAREVASSNERLRAAAADAFHSWIDAAERFLRDAGVGTADAHDLAVVFVATVEGGFVLSRTLRDPEPLLAAARTVAPLVGAAIDRARVARTS